MTHDIASLAPIGLWKNFVALNKIPRASKKEAEVVAFMVNFGKQLGLETHRDAIGNVVIRKPATKGLEHKSTIVLQSHVDMVHQKNSDTQFDFDTQGIEMYIDGDRVKAKGTTLGADNGIGVATAMALLESTDIPHPAIEALFTVDEETGMTGALSLKGDFLKGKYLLNLDTEADNEITIGCAGGVDVTINGTYNTKASSGDTFLKISLKGLTGGHSGGDIHLGRGNANKLMNRILWHLIQKENVGIAEINGGSLRNAIPRESMAVINYDKEQDASIRSIIEQIGKDIRAEYALTDPEMKLSLATTEAVATVMSDKCAKMLLSAIYSCPNGIYRMSPAISGLVQSSNNVAKVTVRDGQFNIQCLTRSSVDTEKYDLAAAIEASFANTGAKVTQSGMYPGWAPVPGSELVKRMTDIYSKMFGTQPHVNAVHAGLECGIIGGVFPQMEMASFGPNITGAHSPDESVEISSVQKFWSYFWEVLKNTP